MSESRFNWTVALLLTLACCMAYVNTLDGDWVWDDASSVLLHRHVQQPDKLVQLFREDQHAFGRGQGNFYRPLVAASFMLDYYVSNGPRPGDYDPRTIPEVSPFLFHITNALWHLGAALLLFALLTRLGAPRFVRAAAPLLFVVHPLHTEAVAYISGRADMMSAVAIFAALYFAVGAARLQRPLLGILCASLCFIGGLFSKESTLIYPILLALIYPIVSEKNERTPSQIPSPRLWRYMPLLSAFFILCLYLLLRVTVLRFGQGEDSIASPLPVRLFETIQSLGVYAMLLFVPTGLHMERTLDNVTISHAILGIVFLVALISSIGIAWRQGERRIAAGFGWFLASWLPISGIFPLNAPLAEHWMYVPMAGFWWALLEIAALVCKSPAKRQIAYATVCMFCVVFLAMTVQRNRDWNNNERLFRATLRENPHTVRVHYNLAVTYENLHNNLAGARRHYEHYLELRALERADGSFTGDEIEARLSLGRVLLESQEYMQAVHVLAPLKQLADIEAWRPAAALAATQTGQALLALGDIGQANMYFQDAMTISPDLALEIEALLAGLPLYDGY